ncbi:DUF1573 domain-containing protein [Pedobacter changchengzhani]|uniref:DUF1573 domain-containing protein n=1 Tax=Pedobacter changchengzhani TaxID=2529274 RepID=A0A4R5MLN8_9SPHI|nr:DUF1573 domain-containing protein [Pedobacter changchengzhani]TDG36604.1 DUF1573 domain-containing protein [Pedobacter changchengzhani]
MKRYILVFLFVLPMLNACVDLRKEKTTVEVIDNNRHYYPIQMGQKLEILFHVKNTGKHPLIISDIITSCGCLVLSKSNINNIPSGDEAVLSLTYNSAKNVGYVKHYITLYGNFLTDVKQELIFDVNVVPDALYTKDYEELYKEEKEKYGDVKSLVDGNANNQGYYMGDH